nr:reverse transcriptase domain-containing protein [Tanacetum cinerariifolium]
MLSAYPLLRFFVRLLESYPYLFFVEFNCRIFHDSEATNRRRFKRIVEPDLRTIEEIPVATMADMHTMSELLQEPIEGYRDATVIPAILAKKFEIKVRLLSLITSSQFHGFERDDPHFDIQSCVTCGGPHPYYECLATGSNTFNAFAATGTNNQGEEKQIDTESMQELLLQLSKDLQTLSNTSNQLKHEVQDSSQYWKPPVYYSDDGGDFYKESIDETTPSDVIALDLPITDSLVMDDEHLDTILEMDLDKEIESSTKNLNLTTSEYEDLSNYASECDLPFCDNSLDFNNDFEIFSNPLFDSKDDYTSSDDESSSKEDVLVEHFKSYSNPLLEFNEEIFSSEINQLYNEVLEDLDPIPLRKEDVIFEYWIFHNPNTKNRITK